MIVKYEGKCMFEHHVLTTVQINEDIMPPPGTQTVPCIGWWPKPHRVLLKRIDPPACPHPRENRWTEQFRAGCTLCGESWED